IARKVDAIIVNPVDPQGIMSAIKKVHAKKIPLINVNSQMVPEAKPLSFVGHNTYSFGYVAGRDLAAMYDKKHGNPKEIQAAFLMGFPKELYSQDESNGMISGFVSYYLEKYNKVNFNVVATRYGHWQADTALKEAEDILTANPNLDILFTLDGNMLMGAYSAIQSAGKQGKIMVATAGGRKEELQLIQDPKSGVVSSALVDPRKEGKWAVYLAANAAKKYDVPATFHIPVVGINTENVKDFYNPKSKY
ncbi:MAG: substrate-binding domain-containing protein, partial [Bacteroidota bacterium]